MVLLDNVVQVSVGPNFDVTPKESLTAQQSKCLKVLIVAGQTPRSGGAVRQNLKIDGGVASITHDDQEANCRHAYSSRLQIAPGGGQLDG